MRGACAAACSKRFSFFWGRLYFSLKTSSYSILFNYFPIPYRKIRLAPHQYIPVLTLSVLFSFSWGFSVSKLYISDQLTYYNSLLCTIFLHNILPCITFYKKFKNILKLWTFFLIPLGRWVRGLSYRSMYGVSFRLFGARCPRPAAAWSARPCSRAPSASAAPDLITRHCICNDNATLFSEKKIQGLLVFGPQLTSALYFRALSCLHTMPLPPSFSFWVQHLPTSTQIVWQPRPLPRYFFQ